MYRGSVRGGLVAAIIAVSIQSKSPARTTGQLHAAEQVERLDVPQVLDRSMGDIHPGGNPHIHLDPHRMLEVAQLLAGRLVKIDAANANVYQRRLEDFQTRWQSAIERWQQQALPLRGLSVVAHHKDWRYLLNWLGMEEVATLEPKPGLPPNAAHLASLKKQMDEAHASMILRAGYQ